MASAFDDLTAADARYIRERLLAGDSMADIRRVIDVSIRKMRACRDEVFEPLIGNPENVKALASGGILNPLEVVRYRSNPGRKPRMARPGPKQIEMFPA